MNYYLDNYAVRPQLIPDGVPRNLGIIVVIPCYNEPSLIHSLQSLFDCTLPSCSVEIIVVINASENSSPEIIKQNKKTLDEALNWAETHQKNKLSYCFIKENSLPKKHAGVGLARKIGMDEAVRRFESISHSDGIIVCFDADAKCELNYLTEIENHFKAHSKSPACSIHFEHPIAGEEFSKEIYEGIAQYELHLRIYKNGLAYAGLPYAYHTIGSSMAVRNHIYQKQNGMNKRKAGEDFYFLQKLIPLGDFTEITTTKVIPSPRVSDRVPFGTGKAMRDFLLDREQTIQSYHVNSYIDLKRFCELLPDLYDNPFVEFPTSINEFLGSIDWEINYKKIRKNSTSKTHFVKLFYSWFNAFKVLKCMHFLRDNYYPDQPVLESGNQLLSMIGEQQENSTNSILKKYRDLDIIA
ncbi:MAG: glycosyltransferase family 2 protein [Vicingus serpentipes]|nr:glycosyltransferase family 2 protein [Vicingus serpentipes]